MTARSGWIDAHEELRPFSPWWWWIAYYVVMLGGLWVVYRALAGWPVETQNFFLSIFHRIAG